jgi:hypothetical protein
MKPTILKCLIFLFLGNLLFSACKKSEHVRPGPQTPPPVLTHSFQLTIDSLPGEPVGPIENLFAILSIVNEKDDTVLKNRKLAVTFNQKYRTPELELPAARYRVTKLVLVNGSNQALFATPLVQSAKAGLVSKPLPVHFNLPQPVVLPVGLELLRIEAGDSPESFGYPAGTFNQDPGNPPPGDDQSFMKIKLRIGITVGNIRYDSLPGTVLHFTMDANNDATGRYITLTAGTNEIEVSRKASRHRFLVTKWGVTDELSLQPSEIKEGNLYTIGSNRPARKLKSEVTLKLVGGNYVPESKTSFLYDASGRLGGIDYFLKRSDQTPYLAMRDLFSYQQDRLEKIDRFDEKNQAIMSTSFGYNGDGKIGRIIESGTNGTTKVGVEYDPVDNTGITGMKLSYAYSNGSPGMKYHQRYRHGNRVSDNSYTENNSTETGDYDYDFNINPYAHIGWYNLFLSNLSKNNVVRQAKTYYGHYPVAVAYEFIYKYDAEGYPIELVRHFKSYITNQFLFTTKTVFTY